MTSSDREIMYEALTSLQWALNNMVPDNGDYQSSFNILTNSIQALEDRLDKYYSL